MGTSTDAHCESCGYDEFLRLGGGMQNFQTYHAWPVNCEDCAAITTTNVKKLPLTCEQCKSTNVVALNDQRMWRGDGIVTHRYGSFYITDGHYHCPKCGKPDLRFGTSQIVEMWD